MVPNKNGDVQKEMILAHVGSAISQWEHLEQRLFFLFAKISGLDLESASLVYKNLITSRSRIAQIESFAKAKLLDHTDLLSQTRTILERTRRLSKRRNQIAHGTLGTHKTTIEHDDGSKTEYSGFYWQHSQYSLSIFEFIDENKGYYLNSEDIRSIIESFNKCREELNALHDRIPFSEPF